MAEQPSCKRQVSGSNPLTGSQFRTVWCDPFEEPSWSSEATRSRTCGWISRSAAGTARLEDALNAAASELAPGSNGLLTIPDWLAPGQAAWRRGALLGFDGSQGRAHIYRSILEGIALTMANNTAAMEHALGRRLSPVLVSGGGSRSDLMMQIVADVYGRPARRTTVNDAAGLGAAICAAVGHGIYPGWDQATAAMVSPGQQFTPDPGAARAYQQINQVYATLTSHTDPLFRSMADGLAGLDRT